ncbi:MAG: hypothetical protein FWH38_09815 [Treponema sp.]|nr:hypothetical protein [Treponema sp.]
MPLDLTYMAMEHGPVPVEIYRNRDKQGCFAKVIFEPFSTKSGYTGYLVKPNGKFDAGYFAEAELEEMKNLIEMFAQVWVNSNGMSDMSHQAIKAWKKTYSRQPNAEIDPIEEFDRDIMTTPEEILTTAEERYLFQHGLRAV